MDWWVSGRIFLAARLVTMHDQKVLKCSTSYYYYKEASSSDFTQIRLKNRFPSDPPLPWRFQNSDTKKILLTRLEMSWRQSRCQKKCVCVCVQNGAVIKLDRHFRVTQHKWCKVHHIWAPLKQPPPKKNADCFTQQNEEDILRNILHNSWLTSLECVLFWCLARSDALLKALLHPGNSQV